MVLFFVACHLLRRRARQTYDTVQGDVDNVDTYWHIICKVLMCILRIHSLMLVGRLGVIEISGVESLQFDLALIQAATGNFSPNNKLGEGGFGEVFRVVLFCCFP